MGPAPAVAAVRLAVRRGLRDLPAGELVLVACSGGADSLALAAAAAAEAPRAGLRVGGVTVDHRLQPGSPGRAAAVAATLAALRLAPVEVATAQVGRAGGPEGAARTARYAALAAAADRLGAGVVLLGHSRDDQAETVLLGLARGSGTRSLAGMAPVAGRYRRPLLDLPRSVLRAAALAEGLQPWDDPHNADPTYARARVRHRALPALAAALREGPGRPEAAAQEAVGSALARTARLLRDDADALDAWSARVTAECVSRRADTTTVAVGALAGLPAAVRRRVLRAAALASGAPATGLTAGHVDELDRLVVSWHGQGPLHLPGRIQARRRCDRLLLAVIDLGA